MTSSATQRVRVIAPGQTYSGKQGFTYSAGASAETVGAEQICMNILPMPGGTRAKTHYHKGIETIAYLVSGECMVYYGDSLEQRVLVHAGDQIFLPADVHTRRATKAARRVPGSWCIHQAAIRTASFYCQSLMSVSQR
jgi:uncharacterized RmlC-like cupin family protein